MLRLANNEGLGPGPRFVRAVLLAGFLLHDLYKLIRRG